MLSIHTSRLALTVNKSVSYAPTYQIKPLRTTGAGDTWNGGNILGILLGLAPEQRLLLANAVAGAFIESPSASRPDVDTLISFVENRKNTINEISYNDGIVSEFL